MLPGTILKFLGEEANAAEALEPTGEIVLLAEFQAMGELHDETPADYVCGATRRFAAQASNENWLALMPAIERGDDPTRTTLDRMLRWSLVQDAAGPVASGCRCGKGGSGDARE